ARAGRLVSDQGGLQVEAIALDPGKQTYNFSELFQGVWLYRGDSHDVRDGVQSLHRERNAGVGPFGTKMRCSGCHLGGGLVQKELGPPRKGGITRARPLRAGER